VDVVGSSDYALRGVIKKLNVWEQANGWQPEYSNCDVDIDFEIVTARQKELVYYGTIFSNAMGTNSIIDTTDSNGPVLNSCMEYVVEKLVNDQKLRNLLGFKVPKP